MSRAKLGDKVSIHYIGTLDNGRIFDQADATNPRVFTIGAGEVFPALEEAVVGMRTGEVKNVPIPAEQAYGPRRQENILTIRRDTLPPEREVRVGEKVQIEFRDGQQLVMRVLEIGGETLTLDGNHALAGCDLTFALKLDAIG